MATPEETAQKVERISVRLWGHPDDPRFPEDDGEIGQMKRDIDKLLKIAGLFTGGRGMILTGIGAVVGILTIMNLARQLVAK